MFYTLTLDEKMTPMTMITNTLLKKKETENYELAKYVSWPESRTPPLEYFKSEEHRA